MDIEVPQRCLGAVDIEALKRRILEQEPEAWAEQTIRQQTYEVHKDTESVVMLFCDESWPDGEIYRESGWDRLADVAVPVIDHIIETYYEPGVHVPITSNAGVRYTIGGKPFEFEPGNAYEINNQQKHSVMNMGSEDRISFIFDYVPADQLRDIQG
jgi:hypothetical protein